VVDGSIFVLFVDDDAAFADAAARSFESVGMRTVVALGSMPALDVLDGHDIDVVVTDVKLQAGEPHGSALARMIRKRRPQVPIIQRASRASQERDPTWCRDVQAIGDRRTLPSDQSAQGSIAGVASWPPLLAAAVVGAAWAASVASAFNIRNRSPSPSQSTP
jgi:CheY-like chemotaxis protein